MADRYDVILLGITVDDAERDAAIGNIARVLEANEEAIRRLVENKASAAVKEGVPIEAARKYQMDILRLGGICNFRPSVETASEPGASPIEHLREKKERSGAIPSRHDKRDKIAATKEEIIGTVPRNFNQITAIKQERDTPPQGQNDNVLVNKEAHERMQRNLHKRKLREQQDLKLAEKHEREEQQRRLEEKIRKELSLPRLLNTRLRLFGSATFIWLLGMVMGGGGVGLFYQPPHTKATTDQASAENLMESQEDTFQPPESDDLNMPPQQDTLKQVFAFSHRPYASQQGDSTADTDPGSAPEDVGTPPDNVKVAHLDGKTIWQEMEQDGEWDLFLAAQAHKLVDAEQTAKAYHVADAIASPPIKVKALGHLAEHFRNISNIADSENFFNLAAGYIDTLPDMNERIETHGILALSLWRMGDQDKAQQNLETAEKLALTLGNPADNARNLARVASYQAQIGMKAEANANFRRVNTLIHSLSDKPTLLGAYVKLATSYAESGSRGIALAILNETLSATQGQIKDKAEQNRLFREIADAYVKLGDADAALLAVGRLSPEIRDKSLCTVTSELAYADRLYDAMKSLDKIGLPEYKARAAALVSRLQRSHPDMGAVAAAIQEKALAAQGQISNPQEQSIVRGEFARYLAHVGQTQAAEDWARKAMASAQTIEPAQERDAAYAVLSANLARANLAKLADDAKKMIVAPALAGNVDRENGKIARLFNGM